MKTNNSYDWKTILIGSDASMSEAIQVIDQGALRLALVVDENGHLLGTITDGDIRRSLIRQLKMEDKVTLIMNSSPRVADVRASRTSILSLMEQYDLLSVPLLENGVVVGVETLQHILTKPKLDNPVFLMAGGFGTRLKPLTNDCPKPLLKVGDKPILQTILESFRSAGFHRFYISTHYMPELIRSYFGNGEKWGVTIEYVHEEEPLGTAGALGLLPDDLPDLPVLMMNGDVLTRVDFNQLLSYHNEHSAVATMCVREHEYQLPYGVVDFDESKVSGIMEKPVYKHFVNAGIYVLSSPLIKSIDKNVHIDMPDLLNRQISDDANVCMFPIHEYWLDIGRLNDFEKAQNEFSSSFN